MKYKIFVCLFFVFIGFFLISRQANYLFGGDSAEYSTVLTSFSVPHAPGYPLYSFIGNIITRIIPFGTNTWKAGLLSSIPTLLTSIFIYLILFKITSHRKISLYSSIFYVFLYPIWLYAEVPEVFALNNLFIVIITYFLLKYNDFHQQKIKYLIYLFIGFSIAHHHTFILFIPGWYFLIKNKYRSSFFLKNKLKNLLVLLSGTSFYIYTIVASYFNPPIDWENSKTLSGFIRLIFRTSYGTFNAYAGGSPDIKNQIYDFFSVFVFILQDFRILGVLIIIIGLIHYLKRPSNFSKFLLFSMSVQLFFLFYTNFYLRSSLVIATFERYVISLYLVLVFYFAYGLITIEAIINKYLFKFIKNCLLQKILIYSYDIFLYIFLLILFFSNFAIIKNVKNSKEFENYGHDIINTLPSNSILYVRSDVAYFATQYIYSIEKERPDIKLIFANLLSREYYAENTKIKYPEVYIPTKKISETIFFNEFLEKNGEKFPIFYEFPSSYGGYWQPYGLLWKYYPSPESAKNDTKNLIIKNNQLWSEYLIPKFNRNQKSILFLNHVTDLYSQSLNNYLNFLFMNDRFADIERYSTSPQYNILDKNIIFDLKAQISIKKNDCYSLKKYVSIKKAGSPYELSLDQVKTILKYYGLCDKNSSDVYFYFNLYKKYSR